MILAQLIHALTHPDEYEFEWRDGELYIRPRPPATPAKAERAEEHAELS